MQHFSIQNDVEKVLALGADYVPGLTENKMVFGIRNVLHSLFYPLYKHAKYSVGIAGTHSWYLLCMFPEIAQAILYPYGGREHWDVIEDAWRSQDYPIHCLGYDKTGNMDAFQQQIETVSLAL